MNSSYYTGNVSATAPAQPAPAAAQPAPRKKSILEMLSAMHGAGNAKDAAGLRRLRDETMQLGYWGGDLQKIYEGNIKDAEAQEKAAQAAQQRQIDVGNQKNALINQYGDQARRGLANSMAQAKRDANRRGLLFSNQLETAKADMGAQAAGDMASYRTKVNQASDDQLGNLATQSAQQGMQSYGNQITQNQNDYGDALRRRKQRTGIFDAIGEGIGKLGGLLPI